MTPAPKVRIRCGKRGCSRVLAELFAPEDYAAAIADARSATEFSERVARVRRIYAPPEDWIGKFRLQPCPKHDKPRRQFAQEVLARAASGYDPRPQVTMHDITWTSIAPAFRLADARGGTTEETILG